MSTAGPPSLGTEGARPLGGAARSDAWGEHIGRTLVLPRDTTRQADGLRHAEIARLLHRFTGTVLTLFVLVHVVVQMVRKVPAFATWKAQAPWLEPLQQQPWIHAVLFFSVAFHTLYGLKLLAGELGVRMDHRRMLWIIVAVSLLPVLWELSRYVRS